MPPAVHWRQRGHSAGEQCNSSSEGSHATIRQATRTHNTTLASQKTLYQTRAAPATRTAARTRPRRAARGRARGRARARPGPRRLRVCACACVRVRVCERASVCVCARVCAACAMCKQAGGAAPGVQAKAGEQAGRAAIGGSGAAHAHAPCCLLVGWMRNSMRLTSAAVMDGAGGWWACGPGGCAGRLGGGALSASSAIVARLRRR